MLKRRSLAAGTNGLVGETPLAVLPQIAPAHTAALVLALQLPLLVTTWRRPRAPPFAAAVCCCGLAAFLCGWHVHEKAILPPLVVLSALVPGEPRSAQLHARLLVLLSTTAHYSLLPLLHQPAEYLLARVMCLLYLHLLVHAMRARLGGAAVPLRPLEVAYLCGFGAIEFFCAVVHPALIAPRLEFAPLLLTSVYCAVGVHYSAWLAYAYWWREC